MTRSHAFLLCRVSLSDDIAIRKAQCSAHEPPGGIAGGLYGLPRFHGRTHRSRRSSVRSKSVYRMIDSR